MTLTSILALAGAMFIKAVTPGPGVFTVVARTTSAGLAVGIITVIGILSADFVFILLAVYGLSAVAEIMGSLFIIVKYVGGAYLIWLGIQLWRSQPEAIELQEAKKIKGSWWSNYLTGFLVTLGNPKAIFFYIGFFPAFLDLKTISAWDIGIILMVTTISIGGVMFGYAYAVSRARTLFNNTKARKRLDATAGTIMVGTGTFMIARG